MSANAHVGPTQSRVQTLPSLPSFETVLGKLGEEQGHEAAMHTLLRLANAELSAGDPALADYFLGQLFQLAAATECSDSGVLDIEDAITGLARCEDGSCFARTLMAVAESAIARKHFTVAGTVLERLREATEGDNHHRVLEMLSSIRQREGHLLDCKSLLEELSDECEPGSLEFVRARMRLGDVLCTAGNYERACWILQDALGTAQAAGWHEEVLGLWLLLGRALRALHRPVEAETLFRFAEYRLYEQRGGTHDARYPGVVEELAGCLSDQGRQSEWTTLMDYWSRLVRNEGMFASRPHDALPRFFFVDRPGGIPHWEEDWSDDWTGD